LRSRLLGPLERYARRSSLNRKLLIPVLLLLFAMGVVIGVGAFGVFRITRLNAEITGPQLQRVLNAHEAKAGVEEGRAYAALATFEADPDRAAFYRQVAADHFARAADLLSSQILNAPDVRTARSAAALGRRIVEYAQSELLREPPGGAHTPESLAIIVRALTRVDVTMAMQALVDAAEAEIREDGEEIMRVRDRMLASVAFGAIAALGLALWLALWMLNAQVAIPIARLRAYLLSLSDAAGRDQEGPPQRRIAPTDLLSQEIPLLDQADEFGDIARAIETARDRGVALLDNLAQAREVLIEQERMASLGRLVAAVAHEINTPLGVSITTASLLSDLMGQALRDRRSAGVDPAQERMIERLEMAMSLLTSNLERAGRLIQSFKNISADQHYDAPRQVDLRQFVAEIVESLKPEVARRGAKLEIAEGPPAEMETRTDAIWQILSNLILNAAVHAFGQSGKGTITVALEVGQGQAEIRVRDDGRGVPQEIRARIFEPFFTTRRDLGGTGLGLAIAYTLAVEVLKGRLICVSPEGGGAQFTLTFPCDPIDPAVRGRREAPDPP
jgi:signal transduction histidine kinase